MNNSKSFCDMHLINTRPAVFFDRDGVLNYDSGYTYKPEDLRWIDGAIEAVRWCNDNGCFVFVVTNQSGVARGYYTEQDVDLFHSAMQKALRAHGAHVDEFIYCPHHENGTAPLYARACGCRKPQAGMLRSLLERWPVDIGRSILIGDKKHDLEAAAACGVPGAHFVSGNLMSFLRKNYLLR